MRAAISSGVVLLTVSLASAAVAQNAAPALRVATFVLPPYVMAEGDHLTGFSIDLWNAVAARLKVDTDYQRVADVAALLDDFRSDKADVGVSGVFITAEREQYVDFSVSVLNAGM